MPPTTLDADLLEKLIAAAVAAPSVFNTQPWRFRHDERTGTLEVRAAGDRGLRHVDPVGRALHLSVGAALFNLRVAASHFGREPVLRLLPAPADPGLLAVFRFAGAARSGGRPSPGLYESVWHRHSSRYPFSPVRPSRRLLTELQEAARAEGATLLLPDDDETARLLRLTAEAERRNGLDAARRMESRRWIREGTGDGIPGAALGVQDATERIPVRDHAAVRPASRLPAAVYEHRPLIAVLATEHDRRADWLRAGQALEHVLLLATDHVLRTALFHQAMEWPDLRAALYDTRNGRGHVHMLIRLGYGPPGPVTLRRPPSAAMDAGVGPGRGRAARRLRGA